MDEPAARHEEDACAEARRRDRGQTTRQLKDAALEVFARRGFDAATTREVAAAAGVNEALIQRYFGGKNGLLLAIVEGFCGEGRAGDCRLAPLAPDLEQEIAAYLAEELRQGREKADFMRVLLSRAVVDPALAAEVHRHITGTRAALLEARLGRLREAGRLAPDVDVAGLAAVLAVLGLGLGFLQQMVFADDPGRIARAVATAARALANGAAATPPR